MAHFLLSAPYSALLLRVSSGSPVTILFSILSLTMYPPRRQSSDPLPSAFSSTAFGRRDTREVSTPRKRPQLQKMIKRRSSRTPIFSVMRPKTARMPESTSMTCLDCCCETRPRRRNGSFIPEDSKFRPPRSLKRTSTPFPIHSSAQTAHLFTSETNATTLPTKISNTSAFLDRKCHLTITNANVPKSSSPSKSTNAHWEQFSEDFGLQWDLELVLDEQMSTMASREILLPRIPEEKMSQFSVDFGLQSELSFLLGENVLMKKLSCGDNVAEGC